MIFLDCMSLFYKDIYLVSRCAMAVQLIYGTINEAK